MDEKRTMISCAIFCSGVRERMILSAQAFAAGDWALEVNDIDRTRKSRMDLERMKGL
jgi:hypothetical protein